MDSPQLIPPWQQPPQPWYEQPASSERHFSGHSQSPVPNPHTNHYSSPSVASVHHNATYTNSMAHSRSAGIHGERPDAEGFWANSVATLPPNRSDEGAISLQGYVNPALINPAVDVAYHNPRALEYRHPEARPNVNYDSGLPGQNIKSESQAFKKEESFLTSENTYSPTNVIVEHGYHNNFVTPYGYAMTSNNQREGTADAGHSSKSAGVAPGSTFVKASGSPRPISNPLASNAASLDGQWSTHQLHGHGSLAEDSAYHYSDINMSLPGPVYQHQSGDEWAATHPALPQYEAGPVSANAHPYGTFVTPQQVSPSLQSEPEYNYFPSSYVCDDGTISPASSLQQLTPVTPISPPPNLQVFSSLSSAAVQATTAQTSAGGPSAMDKFSTVHADAKGVNHPVLAPRVGSSVPGPRDYQVQGHGRAPQPPGNLSGIVPSTNPSSPSLKRKAVAPPFFTMSTEPPPSFKHHSASPSGSSSPTSSRRAKPVNDLKVKTALGHSTEGGTTVDTKRSSSRPPRQPHIACMFCRKRKIACIPGPSGDKDVGPCMPCSKRELVCQRPPINKRGHRKRGANADLSAPGDEDPSRVQEASFADQSVSPASVKEEPRYSASPEPAFAET